MKIQESGENYLETILMLEQKNGTVRSIDIANELEFSKPSVSRAMSILRTAGYITMDKNNLILHPHPLFGGSGRQCRKRRCRRLPHRAHHQRGDLRQD